jgi:hypothetical protein
MILTFKLERLNLAIALLHLERRQPTQQNKLPSPEALLRHLLKLVSGL